MTAQKTTQQAAPVEPVARLHIRATEDYLKADVEILDGTHLQPEDSPVDLYLAPATQQAAKAETAEQSEGEQANVLPPTRGTDSQPDASGQVLSDDEIKNAAHGIYHSDYQDSAYGYDIALARAIEAEVARRFRAQGGITNTECTDLAPTTSTVSAPDSAREVDLTELDNTAKEALRDLSHVEIHLEQSGSPRSIKNRAVDVRLCIKELRAAINLVSTLRTTSGKGEAG